MAISFNECIDETPKIQEPIKHDNLTKQLLNKIGQVDFLLLAFPEVEGINKELSNLEPFVLNEDGSLIQDGYEKESKRYLQLKKELAKKKVNKNHIIVNVIKEVLRLAVENNWGLCRNETFIYLYNGAYWLLFDESEITTFLSLAAEKMGVKESNSRYHRFADDIFDQFYFYGNLPKAPPAELTTLINLKNGTFRITPIGGVLQGFQRNDFLKYQLPFEYQPTAKAPVFYSFLNKVLPDIERQTILAEYLAYVFIQPGVLKLEKVLFLYGTGANGKSVFFEIVNALLGKENISSYSLQNLTDQTGYYRASLANKLVNYASEINGSLETDFFKQLASGEPVSARLPHGKPFILTNYAKMIFNGNVLPKDVEHTNAYFRRFLIIPFDVTIPEAEQDKELDKKIINNELAGVFNWILEGLERLLKQRKFSKCDAAEKTVENFKKESDTVMLFIEELNFQKDSIGYEKLSTIHQQYKNYCIEGGFRAVSNRTLADRLRNLGYVVKRIDVGNVVYIKVKEQPNVDNVDNVAQKESFF
jgi:putative DNA primase/helicase